VTSSLRDSTYSVGSLADEILAEVEEAEKVAQEKTAAEIAPVINSEQAKSLIKLAEDLRESVKNPRITYDDVRAFTRSRQA